MNTTLKTCFKCSKEKPISEFYKHPRMTDGYLGKCKECTKNDVSNNYRDHFEAYQTYEQSRFKNKDRKAKVIGYQQKRRLANPEKYTARTAVGNAIRDGRLKRSPCGVCGNTKSQAHHPDYSKPLDVIWLCFECHRKAHGQLRHASLPVAA